MKLVNKGDRLIYVGGYAPGIASGYSAGTVESFKDYGRKVTVRLDDGLYADWLVDETEPAPIADLKHEYKPSPIKYEAALPGLPKCDPPCIRCGKAKAEH